MVGSPTMRSLRVGTAAAYEREGRTTRRPQHRFNLKTLPYQIQPLMIAPVLPGETLNGVMLQAQSWSEPLKAGIMRNIGWWCEYFFFYCKHRDLLNYDRENQVGTGLGNDLMNMVVQGTDLAAHRDLDGNVWSYTPPGGVDFVSACLTRIVDEYFRDEGEAAADNVIGGVPIAKIYGRGQDDWSARLTWADDYEDRRTPLDVDGDGEIYVSEIERAYGEWAAMKDAGLVDMDYEDWMKTYGVRSVLPSIDRVDYHRPELLAHHREFSYPTNTVEPTTGVPATAVGWRTAQQFRKAWLFPEPGFIIGVTCKRPKVYLGAQKGNLASMMQTREAWLPAVLNDQMDVSHLLIPKGTGPLSGVSTTADDDYYVDLRDLMNYGDQFINYAPSAVPPFVTLPEADGQRRYPLEADVEGLFASAGGVILEDGVVSLSIKGRQRVSAASAITLGRA